MAFTEVSESMQAGRPRGEELDTIAKDFHPDNADTSALLEE